MHRRGRRVRRARASAGLRHGIFSLFKTRPLVLQGVVFLFQRMTIVLQCGLALR